MKRMSIALAVMVSLSGVFASASADPTKVIWVISVLQGGKSVVSDSYHERDRAIAVANKLNVAPDVWATVEPSNLHKRKDPNDPVKGKLVSALTSLFDASVLYAQAVQDTTAVILPSQARQGVFDSPDVLLPVGVVSVTVTPVLSAADQSNPLTELQVTLEQTTDGGVTWRPSCGIGVKGTTVGIQPYSLCGMHSAQPVRAHLATCYQLRPTDACNVVAIAGVGVQVSFSAPLQ